MKSILLTVCGISLLLLLFLAVLNEPGAMKVPGICEKPDKDITFIDTLYAVTVNGRDDVWTCGFNGSIYHSDNSGSSWTKQETSTSKTLFDIAMLDKKNGFSCGQGGTIMKTNDSGETWNSMPEVSKLTKSALFKMSFVGTKTGCVVGDKGAMLFTHDGGVSWNASEIVDETKDSNTEMIEETETDSLLQEGGSGQEYILYSVNLADDLIGYAVGEFSVLLKTSDGGRTWSKSSIQEAMGKTLFSVFATTKNEVWVVGIDGLMLFSDNGGKTWIQKELPIEKHLFDIKIIGNMGYAIGKEGIYLISSDGGDTWKQVDIGAKFYLQGIAFNKQSSKSDCGWIVGAHGWILNTGNAGMSFDIVRRSPEEITSKIIDKQSNI